jgi:hypothetical protein
MHWWHSCCEQLINCFGSIYVISRLFKVRINASSLSSDWSLCSSFWCGGSRPMIFHFDKQQYKSSLRLQLIIHHSSHMDIVQYCGISILTLQCQVEAYMICVTQPVSIEHTFLIYGKACITPVEIQRKVPLFVTVDFRTISFLCFQVLRRVE